MLTESTTSISTPMLAVVVLWLTMIFFVFSLIAPPNATANFTLIASALCAAGAIFLILELDHPFSGIMRISSEPMRNVLGQLGK
jgi:membrane-bound ClpP family serine protease